VNCAREDYSLLFQYCTYYLSFFVQSGNWLLHLASLFYGERSPELVEGRQVIHDERLYYSPLNGFEAITQANAVCSESSNSERQ